MVEDFQFHRRGETRHHPVPSGGRVGITVSVVPSVLEPVESRQGGLPWIIMATHAESTIGVDAAPNDAVIQFHGFGEGHPMVQAAGLGVAYRAKPLVAAQAHAKVDHADLTALLYFQGYRADDFVVD